MSCFTRRALAASSAFAFSKSPFKFVISFADAFEDEGLPFVPPPPTPAPSHSFKELTRFAFSVFKVSRSTASFEETFAAAAESFLIISNSFASSSTRSAFAFDFLINSERSDMSPPICSPEEDRRAASCVVLSFSFCSSSVAFSCALASDAAAVSTTTAASFAIVSAFAKRVETVSNAFFVTASAISLSPAMPSIASARSLDILLCACNASFAV
mmetsp:Transcript_13705/g.51264  ORF Transcript_13705/g.51264 Transcript_13705/m.51264 type:complete len:214 (-) Transcript_13705:145-786(-)